MSDICQLVGHNWIWHCQQWLVNVSDLCHCICLPMHRYILVRYAKAFQGVQIARSGPCLPPCILVCTPHNMQTSKVEDVFARCLKSNVNELGREVLRVRRQALLRARDQAWPAAVMWCFVTAARRLWAGLSVRIKNEWSEQKNVWQRCSQCNVCLLAQAPSNRSQRAADEPAVASEVGQEGMHECACGGDCSQSKSQSKALANLREGLSFSERGDQHKQILKKVKWLFNIRVNS